MRQLVWVVLISASGLANPWLGPELSSGAPTPTGPAAGNQYVLRAGMSDTGLALVTWHQHVANDHQAHVAGTLVNADGSLATPYGLRLSDGLRDDVPLGVAFDGANFAVLWNGPGLFLTRVTPQGTVLDSLGVQLPYSSWAGASLAFDGTNYVVVWSYPVSDYDIVAARISPQGVLLDPTPQLVAQGTGDERAPSVACGAAGCFVAWQLGEGAAAVVQGKTWSAAGAQGPTVDLSAAGGTNAAVSAADTGFLVAWQAGAGASADVAARGVAADGVPDAAAFLVTAEAGPDGPPQVAFDGAHFLVGWRRDDQGQLRAARVAEARTLVDLTPINLTTRGNEGSLALAASRSGARLVAWEDARSGEYDVYVSRLGPAAQLLDGDNVPGVVSAPAETKVALAAGAQRALVAWETRAARQDVEALLSDGVTTQPVSVPTSSSDQAQPEVAWGGGAYLLTWRQAGSVVGVRVSGAGQVLDATPLDISGGSSSTADHDVTWDGTSWFVAWRDYRGANPALFAARVGVDGVVSPPGGFFIEDAHKPADTKASCLGTRCLVTYRDYYQARLYAVATDGTTAGAPFRVSSVTSYSQTAVANDGTSFLLAWADSSRDGSLFVARVSPAGAFLDTSARLLALGTAPSFPSVTWDGQRYLVLWDELTPNRLDVKGAFVSAAGEPSPTFSVAQGPFEDSQAAAGAFRPGHFLVAYSSFDASPGVNAMRLRVRLALELGRGTSCAQHAECGSGFCVDGVCCDTACGGSAADCQACSGAAGASADGTCTVLAQGAVCRAEAGECDVAETCDGSAVTCGADQARPDGTACTSGVCGAGACVRTDRPVFTSVPEAMLTCGKAWGYSSGGGAPAVAGAGPYTFALRMADGSALPEGLSLDEGTGALSWQPTPAQVGEYELELSVSSPTGADTQRLRAEVTCGSARLGVGCGSTVAPSGLVALAALALLGRRRR